MMRKTIQISNHSISYVDVGKGPVIVFLHGFPLCSDIWLPMIELLKNDYRVIAPDLRGHGASSSPQEEMYSMDELASDIHALLQNSNVESCHLIGHSMGGYIALAFAEKYPSLLKTLTLFHSTGLADTPEGVQKRKDTVEKVLKEGTLNFAEGMTPKLFSKSFLEHHPNIANDVKQWMAQTSQHSIVQSLKGMASRPDRNHILGQLKIKTLFIVGNEDELIPPSRTIDSSEKALDGTLVRLDGVGHMGMLEAPEASVSALRNFLSE